MAQEEPEQPPVAEQAEEMMEKAADLQENQSEQHQALLEAAAEGEEAVLEETEQVTIGRAKITAKTTLEGKTMRKVEDIYEGDVGPVEMLDVGIDVLTDQTEKIQADTPEGTIEFEDEVNIREFYRQFIDNHDAEGAAELCFERVVEEPNELEQKRQEDAMQSFQGQGHSGWDRRVGDGGPSPE